MTFLGLSSSMNLFVLHSFTFWLIYNVKHSYAEPVRNKTKQISKSGINMSTFLKKKKKKICDNDDIAYFRYCIKLKLCILISDFEDFHCFAMNRFSITIFCCIIVRQGTKYANWVSICLNLWCQATMCFVCL